VEGYSVVPSYGLGSGILRPQAIATPAAGGGFTVVVPGNETWLVELLGFQLVTAAGGSARTVFVDYQDPQGNVYARTPGAGTQAGSLTDTYSFGAALNGVAVNTGDRHATSLPHALLLSQWKLVVGLDNAAGADQISAIFLRPRAYPTGPDFYPDANGGD
jgi:hypothetical protein